MDKHDRQINATLTESKYNLTEELDEIAKRYNLFNYVFVCMQADSLKEPPKDGLAHTGGTCGRLHSAFVPLKKVIETMF